MVMNNIDNKTSIGLDPSSVGSLSEPVDLKLLVFDMGKVFVRFEWAPIYETFASVTKSNIAAVKEAFTAIYFPY